MEQTVLIYLIYIFYIFLKIQVYFYILLLKRIGFDILENRKLTLLVTYLMFILYFFKS